MLLHLVLSLTLSFFYAVQAETSDATTIAKKWDVTHATAIWQIHEKSLPRERVSWSSWSLEEYARELWRHTSKPTIYHRREAAFDVFKSYQVSLPDAGSADLTNQQLWHDLSLFAGQKNPGVYTVKAALPTITEIGIASSCLLLSKPTTNLELLLQRQSVIKSICANTELQNSLAGLLKQFSQHEHVLLQFWDERQHFFTDLHKSVYFDKDGLLNALNDHPVAMQLVGTSMIYAQLTSSTIQGLAACILAAYGAAKICNVDLPDWLNEGANYRSGAGGIIGRYIWDFFENNQLRGATALAIGAYCGYSAAESFKHLRGLLLYIAAYSRIIYHTGKSLAVLDDIIKLLKAHNLLESPIYAELKKTLAKPGLQKIFAASHADVFKNSEAESTNFLNAGYLIAFLEEFFINKTDIETCLVSLAEIDTFAACAKNICTSPERWCFPDFTTGSHPYIIAEDFWHPILQENAVPNSLTLGCDGKRPHVIITGANAGGKSTTMKALLNALVFAQTLGISPAKSLLLTLFTYFETHLSIHDDIGAGNSLYTAEVKRAQRLLNLVKNAPTGAFLFCIFDEMFNSTTPVEGCASAISLAEELALYNNLLCMIATHFIEITELESSTEVYTNMNVSVVKQADDSLCYPFKLAQGVSHQHVALDILRKQGFSGSFIDRAEATVRRIAPVAN